MKKLTDVAAVEGDVIFDRAKATDTPCTCCPDGRHIWMRYVAIEDFNLTLPRYVRSLLEQHPELEGKRVRVTFSVWGDDGRA